MDDEIQMLVEKAVSLLKAAGAKEVYLFGSLAQGKVRENSDLDLAVSSLPPRSYFQTLAQLLELLNRPVDLIDLDEENSFTSYLKSERELQRVG